MKSRRTKVAEKPLGKHSMKMIWRRKRPSRNQSIEKVYPRKRKAGFERGTNKELLFVRHIIAVMGFLLLSLQKKNSSWLADYENSGVYKGKLTLFLLTYNRTHFLKQEISRFWRIHLQSRNIFVAIL